MGIEFKILKHLATISETDDGTKELNIVSWNRRPEKYDIRRWDSLGHPGKGITLTEEEYDNLVNEIMNCKSDLESILNEIRNIEWIEEYENGFAINGDFFDIADMTSEFDIIEDDNLLKLCIYIQIPFCQIKSINAVNVANSINQWFYKNDLSLKSFVDFDEQGKKYLVVQGCDIVYNTEKIEQYKEKIENLFEIFEDELQEICFEETIEDILKKCQANIAEAQKKISRVFSNENDKYNNEKDDELDCKAYKIQFQDFIVIGDSLSCAHEEHNTIEITAAIDFMDISGEVTTITTNAYYCEQFGVYYIRRYDYNLLMAKAGKKKYYVK